MNASTTKLKQKSPRLTAAQKRKQAESEYALLEADFEKNRQANWSELWIDALRLTLMLQDMPENFKDENSWLEEYFLVNASEEYFFKPFSKTIKVTRDSLTLVDFDSIRDDFNATFEAMAHYRAEQERLRLEEQDRQLKRSNALAKLTKEDKVLLGLS